MKETSSAYKTQRPGREKRRKKGIGRTKEEDIGVTRRENGETPGYMLFS